MPGNSMNIGGAAVRSGLPEKTIRYYEDIDLVVPRRAANGYRTYTEAEIHKLAFIRRARDLGFSIEVCRLLLSLYEDKERTSSDVKRIAEMHLMEIERKLTELSEIRNSLKQLIAHCKGDDRPDCPIIDQFAQPKIDPSK